MQVKDKAIVLQLIKFGDYRHLVKLYSLQHGLITASVRLSSKPSAKIKVATLTPLNLVEIEISNRQNREIQNISEIRCYHPYKELTTHVVKIGIAQLINEVLLKVLKENNGNTSLFLFLEEQVIALDEIQEEYNEFHHRFLIQLLLYLGIEPDKNYSALHCYFDCREGKFSSLSLVFPLGLNDVQSELFFKAVSGNLNVRRWSLAERRELLNCIIAYYSLHVPGFGALKSLEVLQEVHA